MNKIAVVFGGNGFIGSHLVNKLVASGKYARVISADISKEPRFRTSGVEYLYCDVRLPIASPLLEGVTEIYNLAAVHVTPGHEDWEYFSTNVWGALNVTEFARTANVSAIVFTSSISVYGSTETPKTETSETVPESAYGRSKLFAEKIHEVWQREYETERKLIIARPAVVFGFQERGNFTRLADLLRRRMFVFPGRKDTVKACGYVTDLLNSFSFFLERPNRRTTYNFAFSERYSTEDICHAFNRVAHTSVPSRVIPIKLILFGGYVFEILARTGFKTSINRERLMKLYRSTNIVPKVLDDSGFERSFDIDGALADWRRQSAPAQFS